MKDQYSIDQLLARYYDGATTPEEEIVLHLLLLEEGEQGAHATDLAALEAMMGAATQAAKPKVKPIGRFLWPALSMAAAFAFAMALSPQLFSPKATPSEEVSHVNGIPIGQEQVDRHAIEAMHLLETYFTATHEAQIEANQQLQHLNNRLDESYRTLEYAQPYGSEELLWETNF